MPFRSAQRLTILVCLVISGSAFAQILTKIEVKGPSTITVGAPPAAFKAKGTYSDGSTANLGTGVVIWNSSDPSKLTFDSKTGFATAVAVGDGIPAYIWATDLTGFSSLKTAVTLAPAPATPTLQSFSFSPASLTVVAGQKLTPVIHGIYGTGANEVRQEITSGVAWDNPAPDSSIATISNGTITGIRPETTKVGVTISPLTAPQIVTITVTAPTVPPPSAPTFPAPLTDQSKSLLINGTPGDSISLFAVTTPATPAESTVCSSATATQAVSLLASATSTTAAAAVTLTTPQAPLSPSPFVLYLAQPLVAKTLLCAEDLGPATPVAGATTPPVGLWSVVQTVIKAPTTLKIPTIDTKLISNAASSNTINVTGATGDSISVFQYDPGYSGPGVNNCANWDSKYRTVLPIGSAASTSPIFQLTSNASTPITLATPLLPGYQLCVTEAATGFSPSSSDPATIADANSFGRFKTYFLLGLQASNQLSTSSSSTVGEYLEAGFITNFVRALDRYDSRARIDAPAKAFFEACQKLNPPNGKTCTSYTPSKTNKFRLGLVTNNDVRLSPIPVAATTTTTPTSGTAPAMVTPSVLSSQQAVRFIGNIYAPIKTTSWNSHSDSITLAPLARGGFGTLINPSTAAVSSASSSAASGSTSSVSATNYSSAYYFWGVGTRIAWDRYSALTDEAPQTITQFLVTFGEFSNLPSYVCKPLPNSTTNPYATTNIITSCNQGQYAYTSPNSTATPPTTVYSNLYADSRTLIPRLNIEGLAKLPGYPFVIGVDANLQQYTVFHKGNLDILNKPGNDIRIFIGISLNPANFFSKIGAPSF
jgi:hypothetical protein